MVSYPEFEKNADTVIRRIADACASIGRARGEVEVIAVTKSHPPEAIDYASRFGVSAIGENRVQEAADKKPRSHGDVRWEMIGHLQTNKARLAVSTFDRIQSVDRVKLVRALDRFAGEAGKMLPVLLQVNTGDDPRKYGATSGDAPALLEEALSTRNLRVDGFMTIAPFEGGRPAARAAFERLRKLRDDLADSSGRNFPVLSMGMTGDLEEAIEAGSTCVRIGTAFFGARKTDR